MIHLRTTPSAERDLDEIWLYVARESGSFEAANRAVDSITDTFSLLVKLPYAGRRRDDDLRPGLRSFPAGNYIIVYRVRSNEVQIVRVFHGRRNLDAIASEL